MGVEEMEKKNLDNFVGIVGCKGKKRHSSASGKAISLKKNFIFMGESQVYVKSIRKNPMERKRWVI